MKKIFSLIFVLLIALSLHSGCFSSEEEQTLITIPNEGSVASPVSLTLGTPHSGSINGDILPYESYYTFTLTELSDVTIEISNMSIAQNLDIDYYGTDPTYTSLSAWADNYGTSTTGESLVRSSLPAGTYYFKIYDADFDGMTYTVEVSATPIPQNEGSVASPVVLTVGANPVHSGSVNGDITPYTSYYTYDHTNNGSDITIAISNMSIAQDLSIRYYGTDSTYSALVSSANSYLSSTTGESLTITDPPDGTYYFRIYNSSFSGVTYDISVTNP